MVRLSERMEREREKLFKSRFTREIWSSTSSSSRLGAGGPSFNVFFYRGVLRSCSAAAAAVINVLTVQQRPRLPCSQNNDESLSLLAEFHGVAVIVGIHNSASDMRRCKAFNLNMLITA